MRLNRWRSEALLVDLDKHAPEPLGRPVVVGQPAADLEDEASQARLKRASGIRELGPPDQPRNARRVYQAPVEMAFGGSAGTLYPLDPADPPITG